MTRAEILAYSDQELLDYYDNCITVFTEYHKKIAKLQEYEFDFKSARSKRYIKTCGWLILVLFIFVLACCYQHTYAPNPDTDSLVSRVFGPMYESEEAYQREMASSRKIEAVGMGVCAVGAVVWFVIGIKNRKKAKFAQQEAYEVMRQYSKTLHRELEHPPEPLANSLLVFESIDLRIPTELRRLVFNCLASTHKEAQIAFRREIERSEDKKWRQEMLEAIKESNKKDILDKLEQIGNIKQGFFG